MTIYVSTLYDKNWLFMIWPTLVTSSMMSRVCNTYLAHLNISTYIPRKYCLCGTSPSQLNRPDKHRDKDKHTQQTHSENMITSLSRVMNSMDFWTNPKNTTGWDKYEKIPARFRRACKYHVMYSVGKNTQEVATANKIFHSNEVRLWQARDTQIFEHRLELPNHGMAVKLCFLGYIATFTGKFMPGSAKLTNNCRSGRLKSSSKCAQPSSTWHITHCPNVWEICIHISKPSGDQHMRQSDEPWWFWHHPKLYP